MILDQISSTLYMMLFDDLYNRTVKYRKASVKLSSGFKAIHRCFFQGENQVKCLGIEGINHIDFLVRDSQVHITKESFERFENMLWSGLSKDQIIIENSQQVLISGSIEHDVVYVQILNGIVSVFKAKQSQQATRFRMFDLKYMRSPANVESFERRDNEISDENIPS